MAKELGMCTHGEAERGVFQAEPFERPTEGYNDVALEKMPFRTKFALIKNLGDKVSPRELTSIRKDIRGSSKNALFAANHLDDIFFEDFFAAIVQGIKRERGRQVPRITDDIRRHRIETRVMVSQKVVCLNDGRKAVEGLRERRDAWRNVMLNNAQEWSDAEEYFTPIQTPPPQEEYYTFTEFRRLLQARSIYDGGQIKFTIHILRLLSLYSEDDDPFYTSLL